MSRWRAGTRNANLPAHSLALKDGIVPVTLTEDFATATFGRVTLTNNTWGVGTWGFDDWVNGVDYRQTVTYDPGAPLRNLRIEWSYGANPEGNILAYPSLTLGYKPWAEFGSKFLVGRIDELRELAIDAEVSIGGQTGGFNVSYDLWLTDTPAGTAESITAEVMVWTHPGELDWRGLEPSHRYSGQGFTASVYHIPGMTAGTNLEWDYLAVVIDGGRLDGSVDIAAILRYLVRQGLIEADDYLSSVELGPEIARGSGSMTLHALDYTHSQYDITPGADRVEGLASSDMVGARGGADALFGFGGWDQLLGGSGDDGIYGGSGRDTLGGGAGNDRISGGEGLDVLIGGSGADTFLFTDSAVTGDRITDLAAEDRIDLTRIDARAATAGDDAFRLIGTGAFTGAAGQLRVIRVQDATLVQGDTDGDRRADLVIEIDGGFRPEADQFLL